MLKREALRLLDEGRSVIPVAIVRDGDEEKKVPVSKNAEGKTTWKEYQERLPSASEVETWFDRNGRMIGIVTGQVSDCIVVDADTPEAAEAISKLYNIPLSSGAVSRTGRGGYHFWFKYPKTLPRGCTGIKTVAGWRDKVDIRGDGGYAVAPPSKLGNRSYNWVDGWPTEFLDLPLDLLKDLPKRLDSKFETVLDKGERDSGLTSMVGTLFKRGLEYRDVLPLAESYNQTHCNPPLPQEDVKRIVRSIAQAEGRKGTSKDDSTPSEFRLLTFEEMLNAYMDFTPSWGIEGWLPESTTALVVAPPGMYKTWLLVDAALATATGKPFLGHFQTHRQGPVIIVQQEDAFPMLLTRFIQMMRLGPVIEEADGSWVFEPVNSDVPIYFHPDRSLELENKAVVAGYGEQIQAVKPALALLDPLYSASKTDDYMASAALGMKFMKQLRDEVGTTFMVAHHAGKGKGKEEGENQRKRDSLWGSAMLNAWQETGWQTELVTDTTVRVYRNFKSTGPVDPIDLEFDISEGRCDIRLNDHVVELEERLILFIENNKVSSYSQMMTHLKITSKGTIARMLGRIKAEKEGDYYAIKGRRKDR